MKGKYNVCIWDNKLKYDLVLERQITVIKGKSGTGKSTLYTMFEDAILKGRQTGVHCNCKDKIRFLSLKDDYVKVIRNEHDKIFILDEYLDFIEEVDFARAVQNSDNYFIFITRSGRMKWLTYSANDVYELRTVKDENDKYITRLYSKYLDTPYSLESDLIVTEDSNSGYEMFSLIFEGKKVISAHGRDNVYNTLVSSNFSCAYVIVDGSAFGSCIGRILPKFDNVYIFAPESFEFLLLNSGTFKKFVLDNIENTSDYCDSVKYISWERYFTDLLSKVSKEKYGIDYVKKKLDSFFKSDYYINEIKKQIPDEVK